MTHSTGAFTNATIDSPLTGEQANEAAKAIAIQLADGVIDDATSRMAVAAVVWRSRLIQDGVAIYSQKVVCSAQDRADLTNIVGQVLFDRIHDGGFDLARMLADGTTLSGWVVRFADSTVRNVAGDYWRDKHRHAQVDLTGDAWAPTVPANYGADEDFDDLGVADPDGANLEESSLDIMSDEAFAATAKSVAGATAHQRHLAKERIQRKAMIELLSWPEPDHVDDPEEAQRLAGLVANDHYKVVETAHHLMGQTVDDTGRVPRALDPDEGLRRILSPLSRDNLVQGARHPMILQEYILAAASPRPSYGEKSVVRAIRGVAKFFPGDLRWRRLAEELVKAAAAFVSDCGSEFSTSADDGAVKPAEQKFIEKQAWDLASGAAADYPGSPLGTDTQAMLVDVCQRVETARDYLSRARKGIFTASGSPVEEAV